MLCFDFFNISRVFEVTIKEHNIHDIKRLLLSLSLARVTSWQNTSKCSWQEFPSKTNSSQRSLYSGKQHLWLFACLVTFLWILCWLRFGSCLYMQTHKRLAYFMRLYLLHNLFIHKLVFALGDRGLFALCHDIGFNLFSWSLMVNLYHISMGTCLGEGGGGSLPCI